MKPPIPTKSCHPFPVPAPIARLGTSTTLIRS
jgi:hypothetical protein